MSNRRTVKGYIRWFNKQKGYGFIVPHEGGPDIMLHAETVNSHFGPRFCPFEGDDIEVEAIKGDKGWRTVRIVGMR